MRQDRRPQRAGAPIQPCKRRAHAAVDQPQLGDGNHAIAADAGHFMHQGEGQAAEHHAQPRPPGRQQTPEQHAPEQQFFVGRRNGDCKDDQRQRPLLDGFFHQRQVGRHRLDAQRRGQNADQIAEHEYAGGHGRNPAPGRPAPDRGTRRGLFGGRGTATPDVQQHRRSRRADQRDQQLHHDARLADGGHDRGRGGAAALRTHGLHLAHAAQKAPHRKAGHAQQQQQADGDQQIDAETEHGGPQ